MKLEKVCNIEQFSHFFDDDKKHSIKLVIDDVIIEVNRVILGWWSVEFENKADVDSEIFMTDFMGSKEHIRDCIALLHGKNVTVNFATIPVILKFGNIFKIPELIDAAMDFCQQNISTSTFEDVLTVFIDLQKIGYNFDHLMEIVRNFAEKNWSHWSHHYMGIIKLRCCDDIKPIIDILMYDGPLIKECLCLFNSELRQDQDYEYLVKKLEYISTENQNILTESSNELNRLMDKVTNEVNNPQLLKVYMKFIRTFPTNISPDNVATSTESEEKIMKFQYWRTLSKRHILQLRRKYNVTEYEHAVIFLDWVEFNKPQENDVVEVYQSLDGTKLEGCLFGHIETMLKLFLAYRSIELSFDKLPRYKYDWQTWTLSIKNKKLLLKTLDNGGTIELSNKDCDVTGCDGRRKHTVNVRLVASSHCDRIDVQVIPNLVGIQHPWSDKHTHNVEQYLFWYLVLDGSRTRTGTIIPDEYRMCMCPFYTKSRTDIIEFINQSHGLVICCSMRKS